MIREQVTAMIALLRSRFLWFLGFIALLPSPRGQDFFCWPKICWWRFCGLGQAQIGCKWVANAIGDPLDVGVTNFLDTRCGVFLTTAAAVQRSRRLTPPVGQVRFRTVELLVVTTFQLCQMSSVDHMASMDHENGVGS